MLFAQSSSVTVKSMKGKTIAIACVFPLLLLLTGTVVFILLPLITERYVLPTLTEKLPFDRSVVSISRLTPWSARGTLTLGDGEQTSISIARFEANYSPGSLLRGKIFSVLLDSATIHVQLEDGKPMVRGLSSGPSPSKQQTDFALPVLPVAIERIDLVNTRIAVHMPVQKTHFINLEVALIPAYTEVPDGGYELQALTLEVATRGALQITGQLAVQPQNEDHRMTFRAELAKIAELRPILPVLSPWQIAGKLEVGGDVVIKELQKLGEYVITAEAAGLELRGNTVEVGLAEPDEPAILQLNGDMHRVDYALVGLAMTTPEAVSLETTGFYDIGGRMLQGRFQLLPDRLKASLSGEYHGKIGAQTALSYSMTGESFFLNNTIEISGYGASGELDFGNGSVVGNLRASLTTVSLPEKEVALRDIAVDLPVNFPPADGVDNPGKFAIEEVRYKNEHIGSIAGEIGFTPEQIALNLQATTPLHDGFTFACNGVLRFHENVDVQCNLPEIEFDASHVPGAISLPDGLQFNGKIGAKLNYTIKSGVHRGNATIVPSDIQVNYNEYSFSGINGSLHFPRLPVVQSSPSQLFTIETLELGKLRMADARLFFRVDDAETLFIEEARLRWSGGRVEAGALKLYKGMERVETRLYCDRLSYTELLDQFGVGDAEGGGSLNGRLPIVISREGVEFDDGFLFSTPGDSGIVRFSNTQKLRQGMAAMAKTTYLDYSLDALENFAYNWTKLTFNTEGEELLLTLQLDGKPAQPLPYGYQQGQIVKAADGQGIQHPLRLDVNFRLPMRDLFRYGKSIQSLMENM